MNPTSAVIDPAGPRPHHQPGGRQGSSVAQWIAMGTGGLCCVVGALTMVAWHEHPTRVLVPSRASTPMRYNAAMALVLLGGAVIAAALQRNKLVKLAAGFAGFIAAATLAEFAFEANFGIDDLLCSVYPIYAVVHDARMAPNTAVAFVAASASLLLLSLRGSEWWRLLAALFASATCVLGVVAGLGYATAIQAAYTWGNLTGMSLVAAACLLVLGLGVLAAVCDRSRRIRGAVPWWMPLPVAVILASTTVLLWQALDRERPDTSLPAIVLGAGLAMSVLTVIAVRLAQVAVAKNSELEIVNRSLRALTNCNQALVHAATEQQLLQQTCNIFVDQCGYRLAWIGFSEDDECKTVRPVAAAGVTTDYVRQAVVTWADEPHGRGPTGTCIRSGRPAVVDDVLADASF